MSPVARTKAGLGSSAAISRNMAASVSALLPAPTWTSEQWMKVKSARAHGGWTNRRTSEASIAAVALIMWHGLAVPGISRGTGLQPVVRVLTHDWAQPDKACR